MQPAAMIDYTSPCPWKDLLHYSDVFKIIDILKIEHLFSQSCLKFIYKFENAYYRNVFAMCS